MPRPIDTIVAEMFRRGLHPSGVAWALRLMAEETIDEERRAALEAAAQEVSQ